MIRTTLCLLLLATSAAALAETRVYQWTDENGTVHFSTEPPPASVEGVERRTVQEAPRPGSIPPPVPQPDPDEREAPEEAPPARPDPVAEARRRAELCEQGRQLVQLLEPAYRMVNVTREDGTTETLTGQDRVDELEKARELVAENCDG